MLGEGHKLDGLATGMAEGTISRGRAMKLAGAALLGSALSVFLAEDAEAVTLRERRRRCLEKKGRVFCSDGRAGRCCDRAKSSPNRCRKGRCGGRKRNRADEEIVDIP